MLTVKAAAEALDKLSLWLYFLYLQKQRKYIREAL
jgi:hypothetical protein